MASNKLPRTPKIIVDVNDVVVNVVVFVNVRVVVVVIVVVVVNAHVVFC